MINEIISEIDDLKVELNNKKKEYKRKILDQIVQDSEKTTSIHISVTELHVISIIGENSNINGIKIAQEMKITRGGISKIVTNLVKKGLITSYQDGTNQKKVYYKLTQLGETFNKNHNQWHKERNQIIERTIENYSDQEKDLILKFIRDLKKNSCIN